MATSKTDICNMALAHIGNKKGITSITENNPSAIACNKYYESALKDTISESSWSFCTVRELLAESTDEILGWDYVYTYPVKAATVWAVFDESSVDTKDTQEFETFFVPDTNSRVIGSDLATAYVEYSYIVEDTTIYSSKFITAFSYRLGAAIAMTLTGNAKLAQDLATVAFNITSEAKRIGWSERRKIPSQVSSTRTARG